MVKFFLQIVTDPNIFDEKLRIILLRIPSGIPGLDQSQSKTYWMYFLSQGLSPLSFVQDDGDMAGSLSDRGGTAQGPGLEAFHRRPLIHSNLFNVKAIYIDVLLLGGIGNGRF